MWSPTSRTGLEPSEYGSGPLCCAHYDKSHWGEDHKKDFIWGLERANILAMYYLSTGERPALMSQEQFEIYYR
jgi:hypothetical protein